MRIRTIISCVAILLLSPEYSRSGSLQDGTPIRFIKDTIYHAVVDVSENRITISYGHFPLVSCSIEPVQPESSRIDFAREWNGRSPRLWQSVSSRRAVSSRPSISDTVVEVVARVSNIDPRQVQRILPDRFQIDLSSDFRLVVVTEQGRYQGKSTSEALQTTVRRLLSFGRLRVLTMLVSEDDAQTLYYALEPGTPVILTGHASIPPQTLSVVPSGNP